MEQIFLDNILPQRWAFHNNGAFQFYLNELAIKTRRHPREFELYRHLCGPGDQLIIAVGDSTKFRANKSSDHHLQKQSYNGRLHGNFVTKMEFVDLDGDTILFLPLLASADPVLGDANILVSQADLEEGNQITGGIVRFANGFPGFVICILLDKGFLVHRFNPSNRTLLQFFNQVANRTGRLKYFLPLNPGSEYFDNQLQPAGRDNVNVVINNVLRRRARRLSDYEANSTRVSVTMCRWIVEASYSCDWAMNITGKKKNIPYQYLEEANFQPAPQVSKQGVILYASMVMKNRYHKPFELTFTLPPQVTYANLGTRALERISFRNPLDPINQVQWIIPDLSARRTIHQQWQPINLMNPNQTSMANIPAVNLVEVALGPYTVNLMSGYITSIQMKEVLRLQNYVNLAQYHLQCRQIPANVPAFYFDQINIPGNWRNDFGVFQSCRIIQIPNVPSRNKSSGTQTVVLMYKLAGSPDTPSRFNFTNRNLRTLLGWYCGPSNDNRCPVGSRLAGCCAHIVTAIGLGFTFAHNPLLYRDTHRAANLTDIRPREQDVGSRLQLQRGITTP